jgi:hypothetical protein
MCRIFFVNPGLLRRTCYHVQAKILLEGIHMPRMQLAFLFAAASALAMTAANAAPLNAAAEAFNEGVIGSRLVVETHMCHWGCRYGPMHTPHRHRMFSCVETQCIDWGRLWGREPVFYKRRR